jgi:bacterioferritin
MQGNARVIELLNDVLTGELTAVNQYFVHAKMCDNWGFPKIAKTVRDESIEEMRHAESLVERILFLDGTPNLQRLGNVLVGETVPEQFATDLATELEARERLVSGIALCLEVADHASRELLEHILVDEEDHIDWIETQQAAIERAGLENYLAEQLHD